MRNIFKQVSWLFLAQILIRAVGFFYTVFLARSLGVTDFGLYTVALSYFSIISSFADFGINRFLIREVSIDKSMAAELLCNVVILRLSFTSVLFAIFATVLYLFDPDKMRVSLVLLATLAILPQSVALTFDAIFVAIQKLQFSALALFISSMATALAGLLLINRGFGSMGAINALIFGQLIYLFSLTVFLYKQKILVMSKIEVSIIKKALTGSLPYGLLGVLGLLYFRTDSILLSYMKGSYEAGIYGVAYRFLEAIIFIPSSLALAIFPTMTKLHYGNLAEMKKLYKKILKLMTVLGIITALGCIFVLPEIIKLFLPNYFKAIDIIRVLSLSIPFIFVYVPLSQIILTSDKYLKSLVLISIGTLFFNILLNLIYIPQYGSLGAALITVISDVLSFIIVLLFIRIKIFKKT